MAKRPPRGNSKLERTLFCQTPLAHSVTYLHIAGAEGVAPTCNKIVVNSAHVTLEFLSARHCTIPGIHIRDHVNGAPWGCVTAA